MNITILCWDEFFPCIKQRFEYRRDKMYVCFPHHTIRQRVKGSSSLLHIKCLVILDTIIAHKDFNVIENILNKTKLKKKTQKSKEPFQLLVERNVNNSSAKTVFHLEEKGCNCNFYF